MGSSASGKVTDFNMMLSKDFHGKMTVVENDGILKNEFCREYNKHLISMHFIVAKVKLFLKCLLARRLKYLREIWQY